jgi:3-isopropylmalate/(R)-2-methylmalate dehydratase large subunit
MEKIVSENACQKITRRHLMRIADDGSMILKLDKGWGHEITTPNVFLDMKEKGLEVVFNPNAIKTMIDHVNPPKDTQSAIQAQIMREAARKFLNEFCDVGDNGVCHALIPENAWINPGEIGIMGDSHTCTHGAFCALAAGVGTTELESGMVTGLWNCPPQEVIRVNFTGKLPNGVFAKDLILLLIKRLTVKGATNCVLEVRGNIIDNMSMEARMTNSNIPIEAGGTSCIMMVDKTTVDYLYPDMKEDQRKDLLNHYQKTWNSDEGCKYSKIIDIDVTGTVPVMTEGYTPDQVVAVSSLAGKKADQVYIGSCTNGRIEDLRVAAKVIKALGGKIHPNIRCVVVPATQQISIKMEEEGLSLIFKKAGCHVSGPTCGACLGMSCGVIAPGEVCVSTTNRNFKGRMGKGGMVHLASPFTAAVTAMKGVITNPDEISIDFKGYSYPRVTANPSNWKCIPFETPDYSKLLKQIIAGEVKDFSGRICHLPDKNVDTDQIIPAKYLTEVEKPVFGEHCLENVKMPPETWDKLHNCEIFIGGENFGCGSSREHAVWAFEGLGIRTIIAPSFSRIFKNNMFACGVLAIELSQKEIDFLLGLGEESLSIDWQSGIIEYDIDQYVSFNLTPGQKELIQLGGSVGYMVKVAAELQKEGKL